jgi:hypothetical protein
MKIKEFRKRFIAEVGRQQGQPLSLSEAQEVYLKWLEEYVSDLKGFDPEDEARAMIGSN